MSRFKHAIVPNTSNAFVWRVFGPGPDDAEIISIVAWRIEFNPDNAGAIDAVPVLPGGSRDQFDCEPQRGWRRRVDFIVDHGRYFLPDCDEVFTSAGDAYALVAKSALAHDPFPDAVTLADAVPR